MASASHIAPTLQAALDDWERASTELRALSFSVNGGEQETIPIDFDKLAAPLPRAYEWVDGSAYINHIVLVRKARGAEPPTNLRKSPLVYQGGSGVLLGPRDSIPNAERDYGLDLEAEICAVLGDTPSGVKRKHGGDFIRLFMLANDVSLRNLIPEELEKGFGFFNSKPATAFSPFAVTPDELGDALRGGRVHLKLEVRLNDDLLGQCNAGPEMHFSFHDLIAHITRTRSFTAGTILGSGTVSNEDKARGVSCLAEKRMREIIECGEAKTPFLAAGDRVRIEMLSATGQSVFGAIDQRVVAWEA